MRHALKILLTLCIFLFAGCGGSDSGLDVSGSEPLTDVLTLELTFGDKDLPDEYLLARPRSIAVSGFNEIMIVDEDKVKVYDDLGRPVEIIGGPGQGPGEFERVRAIWLSQQGFITVFGGQFGDTAHFFRPDKSFFGRTNFFVNNPYKEYLSELNLTSGRPEYVVALNTVDRLVVVNPKEKGSQFMRDHETFLFHINNDSITPLFRYPEPDGISVDGIGMSHQFLGRTLYALLPGNRIVYTNTESDKIVTGQGASYTLYIQKIDTQEISTVSFLYDQLPITDPASDYRSRLDNPETDERARESAKKWINAFEDRFANIEYKPTLRWISTDRNFIFAFTFETNAQNEIRADIIDADKGIRVSSAYFPDWVTTFLAVIQNGIVYRLLSPRNEFAVIEKYKIDPAVYGK